MTRIPALALAQMLGAAPFWFARGRAGLSAITATLGRGAMGCLLWPARRGVPAPILGVGVVATVPGRHAP